MAVDCEGCRSGKPLDFDFSMAFQPIFDIASERVWGYEALIRGMAGEAPMPSCRRSRTSSATASTRPAA